MYHNNVTNQTAMSHVQFVIGILLISSKQKIVQQSCLLKQLYEISSKLKETLLAQRPGH